VAEVEDRPPAAFARVGEADGRLERGRASYVELGPGLPLGVELGSVEPYLETVLTLEPRSSLFLYTDGLVDRPDLRATEGLERLRDALDGAADDDLERVCDDVLATMSASTSGDDIAVICLRLDVTPADLHLELPADPSVIADIRHAVRSWLAGRAEDEMVADLVLACSEAASNAVEHAYRGREPGTVEVDGAIHGAELTLVIRDHGRWASPVPSDRGRGRTVMEALVDELVIDRGEDGTEVRFRRTLEPDRGQRRGQEPSTIPA